MVNEAKEYMLSLKDHNRKQDLHSRSRSINLEIAFA